MNIADNYRKILEKIPEGVKLIAITKTKTPEEIMEVYECGHRHFGESKAQEMVPKKEELPDDIRWHMVGHLQSNKVKYIAPFVSLIHSVDSLKLLKVINKEGRKSQRVIPCLLQLHIADETSKFGMSFEETCELLESDAYKAMEHIKIHGLMGMATFTEDEEKVAGEFRQLKNHFQEIKQKYFAEDEVFREISMGMSDDYQIGIKEGSTMVRVGSAIFGERQYT